jgi:hypothetical protein
MHTVETLRRYALVFSCPQISPYMQLASMSNSWHRVLLAFVLLIAPRIFHKERYAENFQVH